MAKRKSSRSRSRSKGRRSTRKKLRLPRAFKIVPIKLRGPVRKHRHVLGQEAMPPCPPGFVFRHKMTIGGLTYCVYENPETGVTIYVLC